MAEQQRIGAQYVTSQRTSDIAAAEQAAARDIPTGSVVKGLRLYSGPTADPRFEGLYVPYTRGTPVNLARNVLVGRQLTHFDVTDIRGVGVPIEIPGFPIVPQPIPLTGPTVYFPPVNGIVSRLQFPNL